MRFLTIALVLAAAQVAAQEGIRASDIKLSKAELTVVLSDQVLEFYTDGLATYHADGRYDYRYSADDARQPGLFEVMDGSRICTVFDSGFTRCDYLVRAGDRYVLVIENGDRYPVRSITPIE